MTDTQTPMSHPPISEDVLREVDALTVRLDMLRAQNVQIDIPDGSIQPDGVALIQELVSAAFLLADAYADQRRRLYAATQAAKRAPGELVLPQRSLLVPR